MELSAQTGQGTPFNTAEEMQKSSYIHSLVSRPLQHDNTAHAGAAAGKKVARQHFCKQQRVNLRYAPVPC